MNDTEDGWLVYFSKISGLMAVKLRMRQIMKLCHEMMTTRDVSTLIPDIGCHPAQGKGQVGLEGLVSVFLL